ncbi:myb-like protein AA [Drosophila obscura]|uniref:myb-like protein AA n=1 Tax=Drosophila obscura TaxID=7282 RepID=UPI001BB27974|nr:myb-like protein AA [Drosophila obscura]XP_022216926.2 myb-like protein AA [Drosophila obscura]
MHFWIDKRSQQCGFGRSRVAASLSHAGNGLSYGHPPRRAKSSSCSTMPPVHRSLPQTPYDCHQPGTSRQSQSQSHSQSQLQSQSQSQSHSQYANNNSLHGQQQLQQQQQHQQQMMQQHSTNNNNVNSSQVAATGTPTASNNITNNNASGTAAAAAVLTGSGTIVPLVARSSRYHPRTQQQTQHQYSYHHPQFGNMVPVRHHDTHQQQQQQLLQQQQHSGVYADDAYSAYHHNPHQQQQQQQHQQHQQQQHHHHQHSSSSSHSHNHRQSGAYATPRRHNSSSSMRQPAAAATSVLAPAPVATAPATSAQTTHSNQLQQQHHALLQHADSQLLPSHLKCGMCASLVLASVFVAGTKFYFDHQGTGLEVLIFCAFSATFFLAACMVSLCRIPKGLLSGRGGARATVCHSRGVNAAMSGASASAAASCLLEMSDVRYLEERQVTTGSAATAGPPPYHIAILLPEQTAAMGKQMPLDESPPPSYDKILV